MTDLNTVLQVENNTIVTRSDVTIYGVLNVGRIHTNQLISNQQYESQFIEFTNDNIFGSNVGTGLLWPNDGINAQFIYNQDPGFWSTESIGLAEGKAFFINGASVLTQTSLGGSVVESNLRSVGELSSLSVQGPVNFNNVIHFDPHSNKLGINIAEPHGMLSVYDAMNDVEVVVGVDINARGRVGTHHARAFDIITDEQARISIEGNGDLTLGQEGNSNTTIRAYGKVGVNVKNPREQFEVAGNIRFANKLMAVGEEAPTSGNYQIGDIVYSAEPKPNGYIGWVCIATGNPGNWKPFGLIAA
jgi:hypothetical protein